MAVSWELPVLAWAIKSQITHIRLAATALFVLGCVIRRDM